MPHAQPVDRAAARERVLADKDTVIKRYTEEESLASIARAYGVLDAWLTNQFITWGVPLRTHAQAMALWRQQRATDTESTFRR
ncbi:hypothetical protein ABT391_03020 [Streptomyces jumonjinensis]|uniref:hypothetical protein n=1 Tax=Streptomyces jumonjinensis TaxID=1945 RepID=UPI003320FB94